jgi:hypothetical protein
MASIQEGLSGIELDGDLPELHLVADAIIILRLIQEEDGTETFLIRNSVGISAIVQIGLMHCAMGVIMGTRNLP